MLRSLVLSLAFTMMIANALAQQNSSNSSNPQFTYQTANQEQNSKQAVAKKQYVYPRHWSFGGGFGMSFWNGGTDILIAPKAYYIVSPKFLTGFGVT